MTDDTDAGSVPGGEGAPAPEAEDTVDTPVTEQETDTQEQPETEQSEEGEQEDDKPKRTPWYQKRIAQLTAQKAALEARMAAQQTNGEAPKQEDIERLADMRAEQKVQEREIVAKAEAADKQGATEFKDWAEAKQAFISNFGDELRAKPEFLTALLALDNVAPVYRHLGLNPDEADRILNLPPARMGVELAKLERTVSAPPKPKVTVSKLPPPPRHIGARTAVDTDPESMRISPDDYLKAFLSKRR